MSRETNQGTLMSDSAGFTILLVNDAPSLPIVEVKRAVAAINKQIKHHFLPAWDIVGRVLLRAQSPDATMIITDEDPEGGGYLGYHDRGTSGAPIGFVYPSVSKALGEHWSVTLSHEVLEMLLDPYVNLTTMVRVGGEWRNYWYEVCDPVQANTYAIDDVMVSDFVYPSYFYPGGEGGSHMQALQPFKIASGGYLGYYDMNGQVRTVYGKGASRSRHKIKAKAHVGRGFTYRTL